MHFASRHVRITAEYGTATLELRFPGEPANALDLDRLNELDAALAAVAANPFVQILVLRSGRPDGFCAGLRPEVWESLTHPADAAAFAARAQAVTDRLANLPAVTVAFLDGRATGAGLELALACDYRLALAHPDAPLEAPAAACMGGSVRLPRLVGTRISEALSAREAKRLGLVDVAFCERRAKIELRSFLDALERRPVKPRRSRRLPVEGFAAERRAFAEAVRQRVPREVVPLPRALNPVPPLPSVVGVLAHGPALHRLAADFAARGTRVIVLGPTAGVERGLDTLRTRGFLTPLEREQAMSRVTAATDFAAFRDAGLAFVPDSATLAALRPHVRPRCVLATADRPPDGAPQAVGVRLEPELALLPGRTTSADALAAVAAWLAPLGFPLAAVDRPARKRSAAPSSRTPVAA